MNKLRYDKAIAGIIEHYNKRAVKLECCFCKSTHPKMVPFGYGNKMFCSAGCLNAHRSMSEIKQRTGLIACFYHGIMVISRCIHRLIKTFRR